MSSPIPGRLLALREQMKRYGVDLYVIPTADFHGSEYVGEYFKTREYLTGFTGSAGTAVVLADEAGLWTDGRYFIQAETELSGSGITLYRSGAEGVPKIQEFIQAKLPQGGCIGFDGRTVSAKSGEAYRKLAKEKQGKCLTDVDLVGAIWEGRPMLSGKPFFFLEEAYHGKSTADKLADLRKEMERVGANVHIVSSLYDIAWLLNIRGRDIAHVPVVLSYLVVTLRECIWFVQNEALSDGQEEMLAAEQIRIMPYEAVYPYVAALQGKAALYDPATVNDRIVGSLSQTIQKIPGKNPTEAAKAVKNPTEIKNTIAAHIKDGVAFARFMYWIKTHIGKERITELSAAAYLEAERRKQEHFLDVSFDTICAYGAHAAMMHYAATPDSDAVLEPRGFLLVDSGGHYLEGTTDITRTLALGEISDEMQRHYTAVLRGCLNLASARFLYGCRGQNLDILARGPLWSLEIDYQCGTGHGVGHLLNVHEGPNAFRWKQQENGEQGAVLEEGMITTDEPGVYIEGAYGIRIENELLCRKAGKNAYGQFMHFETITYAPMDLDAIDVCVMTKPEKEFLNQYHRTVYDTLSPYMTEEEKQWLQKYTRAI